MEKRTLILDFDASYKQVTPDTNKIVLSGSYENAQTLDVRKFKSDLNLDLDVFTEAWKSLIAYIPARYADTLKANESSFFHSCVGPLSRWMEAIRHCFNTYEITAVVFSSYTNNDRIFVYEAEGEINKKLLYKDDYYLPYYLKQYIESTFNVTASIEKEQSKSRVKRKHRLRNFVLYNFILIKQLVFRLTTFKRNYGISKKEYTTILASRAVVQTEFISNYQQLDKEAVLIANEQSFSLLKHLKFLKGTGRKFIYAEGLVRLVDFLRIKSKYLGDLLGLREIKHLGIQHHGIFLSVDVFLPDLLTKELDYTFYATSVNNAMRKYTMQSKQAKVISFEMLTAYAYYLKKHTSLRTYQVQTTLIEPVRNPDFIVSDHFYFTNPITYAEFAANNPAFHHKIGCIPYLKYVGSEKKTLNSDIKSIVYFSQPIDLEEETEIIHSLEKHCDTHHIHFTIKPHPRQLGKFNLTSEKTVIADASVDVERIILDSDVVITRSSSIGLDAWIYGVPPMFPKLNTPLQQMNIFYAPNDYHGTVTQLQQLTDTLENYVILQQKFLEHPLYKELNETQTIQVSTLFNA